MSSAIESFSDRTAACAPVSEHGWALEQVVPVPEGEAKRVVGAARAGAGKATTPTAAANPAAATPASSCRRCAEDEDASTGFS
jgi:hypothetical protein